MKTANITALVAAMLLTGNVMAGVTVDNTSSSNSNSNSGSLAGNSFDQKFNTEATDLSRSVPNPYAPALTTTLTETCMGSTSMGASAAGWGFSFGTTWRDNACVRRLDRRQMAMLGDSLTAREVMCDSDLVRQAAIRAGRPCAADGGVKPVVTPVATTRAIPRIAPRIVDKKVGG